MVEGDDFIAQRQPKTCAPLQTGAGFVHPVKGFRQPG